MAYGVDRWYAPVTLTASNNKFRVDETGGTPAVVVGTVTAGTYWLHDETDAGIQAAYPGLYKAVREAITTGSAQNTYSVNAVTPFASSEMAYACGFQLAADAQDYDIDWGHADFTMDPEWFGFRKTYGKLSISNNISSSSRLMTADYCSRHVWVSQTLSPGNQATDKRAREVRAIEYSHQRPTDRYSVEWNTDTVRTFTYEYVPAVHTYLDRSDSTDGGWSTLYRKAVRDRGNTWEDIWSALGRSETVLIVHDEGDEDWQILTNHATEVEVVKLWKELEGLDMRNQASVMRSGGEFYRISATVAVVDATETTYRG